MYRRVGGGACSVLLTRYGICNAVGGASEAMALLTVCRICNFLDLARFTSSPGLRAAAWRRRLVGRKNLVKTFTYYGAISPMPISIATHPIGRICADLGIEPFRGPPDVAPPRSGGAFPPPSAQLGEICSPFDVNALCKCPTRHIAEERRRPFASPGKLMEAGAPNVTENRPAKIARPT